MQYATSSWFDLAEEYKLMWKERIEKDIKPYISKKKKKNN